MMETKKVDKGTYRRQVDEIGSGTIANLLLMVMKKRLTRSWSFSGLATMMRITLMYYVDFYSLFNHPKKIGKRY